MVTHDSPPVKAPRLARNGRTPAENRAWAINAAAGNTVEQLQQAAERARTGRRARIAERLLSANPGLAGDQVALERRIDTEIRRQCAVATAKSVEAARKRAQARAQQAYDETLDAELGAKDLSAAGER